MLFGLNANNRQTWDFLLTIIKTTRSNAALSYATRLGLLRVDHWLRNY